MAEVSAHLRNYAVAETVGVLGILDSHPAIHGVPPLFKEPAHHQQAQGTRQNPLTHVVPSHLRVADRQSPAEFFNTDKAKRFVQRIFGMGVMAPADWMDLPAYTRPPGQLNVVDSLNENHRGSLGLVEAFVATARAAADAGVWDGSGRHQHNVSSLGDFICEFYEHEWRPRAQLAYSTSRGTLTARHEQARNAHDDDAAQKVSHRIELLDVQIRVFEKNTPNLTEVVRGVMAATDEETWR
jgi:hypothetical protein